MLVEIKSYIAETGSVSMYDLTNHFRVDAETMRGMLAHWIRKGKVRRVAFAEGCGGCGGSPNTSSCGSCSTDSLEIYEWRG